MLAYFRPTIISLVVDYGGGQPNDEIAGQMRRWVMLNWVRITAVAVSIGIGVRALLLLSISTERNRPILAAAPAE